MGVAETTDRDAVPVDGIELAMISDRKGGHVVEESACVDGWIGLQIFEEDHRFLPVSGVREEFPEGVPGARSKHMVPVPHDQDDVGTDSLNDVLPADAVMTQHREVKILDDAPDLRCGVAQCRLEPLSGEFSGNHGRVEAEDTDLVIQRKGIGPIGCRRCSSVVIAIDLLLLVQYGGSSSDSVVAMGGSGFHQL